MPSTPNYIQGKTGPWEVIIGLEVHAQVSSQAKLFSGASTEFGADPNSQVSFVDAGFPGMLPVLNEVCVEKAIRTGIGLNAEIHLTSIFDRKNYFYPDLPQGYQISQFHHPIVGKGYLDIDLEDGSTKRIGVTRLHLEQDAGKSIHDQDPQASLVDLNRSGVALMEIVSEPDLRSAEEAQAYMKKLRALVRCIGSCDGNMEQGSLRADVNVSLRRPGEPFGTRAEIKNVNSIRFIGQAIAYEIQRQMEILEDGGTITQETRLFDPTKGVTRSMRSKEDAHDYRYFPDPDLPPLVVSEDLVKRLRESMPELPDQKRQRFMETYHLGLYDATVLSQDDDVAHFYEQALQGSKPWQDHKDPRAAKSLANWIVVELFALLNQQDLTIQQSHLSPQHMAELVDLILGETLSGKMAKTVFAECWAQKQSPLDYVKKHNLSQVSDDGAILAAIQTVLAQNAQQVADYKSGKDKVFGFLVGMVMKAMQGKANPAMVNELLKKALAEYP